MIPYQNLAYPDKYEHQYTRSGVYQSNVFLWCDYSIQPYEKTSIVKINANNIQCIEIVFILLKNVFYPLNSPNYLRFN